MGAAGARPRVQARLRSRVVEHQQHRPNKESPTADCSGNQQVDGTTGQTVVGIARAGRGTSSACKRLGADQQNPSGTASTSRIRSPNVRVQSLPQCSSELEAWQTGGVHVQGRGFAVVAGEVRTLAQRSAEAAREIRMLIGRSVDTVEAGAADVAQAGQAMEEIVSSVRRVTDLMGEIAAAAVEQRDGIAQVNQAVANLDQMTQQNVALVEESTAASSSLNDQAQHLANVVAVFKVA
ncbi:hypothetical protein EXH51_26565 [Pelomonas saccharophila]|nr:hypothetical protein [Roseateles saccharophilus]